MAHKKGQGSSRNGRDSNGQRRGIKVYEGQAIRSGGIILRQVGAVHKKGTNVGYGRDWTIYSYIDGVVKFESGQRVSVYPPEVAAAKAVNKEPPADHLKPPQPAKNGFTPETKGQSKPPQHRPNMGRPK